MITTGGGFSTLFPSFSQQKAVVKKYLQTPPTKAYPGYSTTGRGYPDVSLAGHNYLIIDGGLLYRVDGTSASTPTVAGMITLINAARRAAGLSTVGWLNPALYASGGSFANDITSGNNKCTSSACCLQGFYTAPGWDPVTGFGSVDFTKLYDLLVHTPTSAPSLHLSSVPTLPPTASQRKPVSPSVAPTSVPSLRKTSAPSKSMPSQSHPVTPTTLPTRAAARLPTKKPTSKPVQLPSRSPTKPPKRTTPK